MTRQIPRGSDDLVCPLHKVPMAQSCHKCPWWQRVRGANPNTGEEIDRWDCAVAFLPILTIEVAQQARQGAAATESFRNEMVNLATRGREQADANRLAREKAPRYRLGRRT